MRCLWLKSAVIMLGCQGRLVNQYHWLSKTVALDWLTRLAGAAGSSCADQLVSTNLQLADGQLSLNTLRTAVTMEVAER
jgi:hypothetical protein